MILFLGKESKVDLNGVTYDENVSRAARIKALRAHFYEYKKWDEFKPTEADKQTHPFNAALTNKDGISGLEGNKSVIVLNAHGNVKSFAGLSGKEVAENLLKAGIVKAATKEIWVAACSVAKQEQDNSHSADNLIKEMLRVLQDELPGIKIYGPRCLLSYAGEKTVKLGNGQTTLAYDTVEMIKYGNPKTKPDGSPNIEEQYAFKNGWLLAQLP